MAAERMRTKATLEQLQKTHQSVMKELQEQLIRDKEVCPGYSLHAQYK